MNGAAVMWLRDLTRFSRDRAQILGGLSRPLLWLVVLGAGMGPVVREIGQTRYMDFIFPGVIAINLLFAAFLSAISIIWDREFGFLKEILVAPISRTAIALGKAASGSTIAVIQGLIVVAFGPLVGVRLSLVQLVGMVLFMFIIAFACTSIGILLASKISSFEGFGVISNFIIMPMFFLSGAIFPIDSLPTWLDVLVRLNPMTYGVDGLRAIVLGVHTFPMWFDVGFMAGFATLMLAWAVRMFTRTP